MLELLILVALALPEKPRAELAALLEARHALPAWYFPLGWPSCVAYCEDGITSSRFEIVSLDLRNGALVRVEMVCDDVPDDRQCGYMSWPPRIWPPCSAEEEECRAQ